MSLKFSISGVFKNVATSNVFKIFKGGAWKDVTFVRIWKTTGSPPVSGWRDVWVKNTAPPTPPPPPPAPPPPPPPPPPTITISVTPSAVGGSRRGDGNVTTTNVTATASGGTGAGYAFSWGLDSVDGDYHSLPFAVSPTAPTTYFELDGMFEGDSANGYFKVTVVDSGGNSASAFVTATFNCRLATGVGGGGGGPLP